MYTIIIIILLCAGGCRTSKEINPLDDEVVIVMKAIIDTDVAVTGLATIPCSLFCASYLCNKYWNY